ncbi:helix-turn-helix domain-containing protein [Formosa haliotis]|uniref:helix-turn-helix domain-containing protein n=1 Tax=Formosa haliotis TaxID=1555194 RepID=UPI0008245CE9|nr:helix-turn-helix domain-containing protein [Formosa haliotis]
MKNKNLAVKVKDLRKRKGYSQEALSEHSGLSLRTIQRVENGETQPTGDSLKKIAQALDSTADELLDWTAVEDSGYVKAMNLSALTFLLFPLLGIIVPLIMYVSKKDKIKDVNQVGKHIINFEITWVLVLFLGWIINILLILIDFNTQGKVNVNIIMSGQFRILGFLIFMYAINIILIIWNTFRIQNNKPLTYKPRIHFIRN